MVEEDNVNGNGCNDMVVKVVDVASIPIGFLFSLNNNASFPQVSPPSSVHI
jgi:hypothetical protein